MGRTSRLGRLIDLVRGLLEGNREEDLLRPHWHLDSLEKCLAMWPEIPITKNSAAMGVTGDVVFAHLRRLYRFGFRLSSDQKSGTKGIAGRDLRLRQFFADGEMYRPEGYSRGSSALIANFAHLADSGNALRVGQCRVAKAGPVLRALGFPKLDGADAFAIQYGGIGLEHWIFIDSRPDIFRRETSAAIAKKLGEVEARLAAKIAYSLDAPAVSPKVSLKVSRRRDHDEGPDL